MAIQLKTDELNGCESYFEWLENAVSDDVKMSYPGVKEAIEREMNIGESGKYKLMRYLFDRDFVISDSSTDEIFGCSEDEIQAKNGMELRRKYAESVGKKAGKSERDTDRIWKSIHGKCSVLELLIHLSMSLDSMTNEEESGKNTGKFFDILLENLEFDVTSSAEDWQVIVDKFLHRKYKSNGSEGGLFPLKHAEKNMKKVPIWSQLNAWLNENLDENAEFIW